MNGQPYGMNNTFYPYTMPLTPYAPDPFAQQRAALQAPIIKKTGTTFGVLALVFGCLAFVLMLACACASAFCTGFAFAAAVIGVVLGILGIVQSAKAKTVNPMAIIGLVFSAVSILLVVLTLLMSVMFTFIVVALEVLGDSPFSYLPYDYYV